MNNFGVKINIIKNKQKFNNNVTVFLKQQYHGIKKNKTTYYFANILSN